MHLKNYRKIALLFSATDDANNGDCGGNLLLFKYCKFNGVGLLLSGSGPGAKKIIVQSSWLFLSRL